MKVLIKKLGLFLLYFSLLPVIYLTLSVILSLITVNKSVNQPDSKPVTNQVAVSNSQEQTAATDSSVVYLNTNGIHLDIVLAKTDISTELQTGLLIGAENQYLSFGWGDADFYLNVPNWSEAKLDLALKAAFLKTPSLMHVTQYQNRQSDWVAVPVNEQQLKSLNDYINQSFKSADGDNEAATKMLLKHKSYASDDNFYHANGSYSFINTCNTWANRAFKQAGLPASLWTPSDKGLLSKY